ncbi:MAG: class I SAM-dependent methyltransferase [Candidatus Magasanikbacteria bacterium]
MKSLYQNKQFAEYWNKRAGESGEVYKQYILDPIMFKLVNSFANKIVLELGCGNGYLAKKFMEKKVKKIILTDISKHNLSFAKQKFTDKNIEYLEQDATKKWKIGSHSIDIIYSNMMFNEVADIKTPFTESFRVLKDNGIFIFSVTHPSWDLFVFAQEKAGIKSKKIKNLGNYFKKGFAKFIMGLDNKTNPEIAKKFQQGFEVAHYHRPLSDYFNTLVEAGFKVNKIVEPRLTKEFLKNNLRFKEYKDFPVGLIFYCSN